MSNYFKTPSLEKDGTLTQASAMLIYEHYLTTNRADFAGVLRKPTKGSIVAAMQLVHQNKSRNLIQEYIDKNQKVLFWSDQHFGHNNIIKYSNRPFEDKNHMDKMLVNNYFSAVQPNDLVVWGGDVAFSSVAECRGLLSNLPGQKVLIMGNHDFDRKNHFKNFHIFDDVFMTQVFHMTLEGKICNIILTHYPIDNKLLPPNTINVHGHTHTHNAGPLNINISVEQINYTPVDLKTEIEELFFMIKA